MAFSAITARGSATEKVSDTTLAMSPSANITVGKLAFFQCVTDNIATADGASNNHSVADSVGNVWNKIAEYTDSDGAANDGVTISLWACRVTVQIGTGNTITLTTTSAVTNKIISLFEATVGTNMSFGVQQVGLGQSAISASVSSLPNREYLLIGFGGSEGNDNTKTADADYTERFDLRTGSGTAATEICTHVQTRIATLTTDTCTSTGWTNTNPVTILAAIYEVPIGGQWNPPPKPLAPKIEWDDPLTRNLVLDVPFVERGGVKPYDFVTGIRGSMQGTPSWANQKFGSVIDFDSAANNQVDFSSHPTLGKFTTVTVEFAIYMYGGGGGNNGYIFCHEQDSQNKPWFAMEMHNYTGGWGMRIDVPDDSTDRAFSVPYPEVRKWEHYVVTFDHSSTSNIPIVYKNGIPISVTDRFTGAWALSTTPTDFVIGNEEGAIGIAADQNFGGIISHVRYWNRILSAGEARSLFENPWRIYESPAYIPLPGIPSTTTPQTITGVARIEKSVTQTVTGKARIEKTSSQTVTGVSRIQKTVTQVITGLARITATTLQIITGKARIEATATQNITGKASILRSIDQTISGVASIVNTIAQTITGKARITATSTQTITGKGSILKTITQVITGLARIQKSVAQTVTGLARITVSTAQTITGQSRITATTTRTLTGLARITQIVLQTITGKARIQKSVAQTVQGTGRVEKSVAQTTTGKSRITAVVGQVLTAVSRITQTTLQTIMGKGRIQQSVLQTISGVASVIIGVTATSQTISGRAKIKKARWYNLSAAGWYTKVSSLWQTSTRSAWETPNTIGWHIANDVDWYEDQ